ncbi:hypothetical protein D3C85_1162420 [compost metagenome]
MAGTDGQQGFQRHHLAAGRAHVQLADVLGVGAELRVGLGAHGVGAAELGEVVDVETPQVDLQGAEDVVHRHAQLPRLDPVHVGMELWHVDLEAGEHPGQLRRLGGGGDEAFGRLVQRRVAQPGAVLQLQAEAAGGAQPAHRRRTEDHHPGALDH